MSVVTPLKTAAEQALSAQFAAAKAELPGALPVRRDVPCLPDSPAHG